MQLATGEVVGGILEATMMCKMVRIEEFTKLMNTLGPCPSYKAHDWTGGGRVASCGHCHAEVIFPTAAEADVGLVDYGKLLWIRQRNRLVARFDE